MDVFITGATGFIGSHVAREVRRRGHHVVALARTEESAHALEESGYRVVRGSMTEPESYLDAAADADAIIHAAIARWTLRAGPRWLHDASFADAIALGTLVEAASRGRCRALVETSGVAVHGDAGEGWVDARTPLRPGAMGRYHLAGEDMMRAAAARGIPACSLRPGFVLAPTGMFASTMLARAARGSVYLVGDGMNFVSPIHIDDLAEAFAMAIETPPVGGAIDIVDDEPLRMRDFADRLLEVLDVEGEVHHLPPRVVGLLAGRPIGEMAVASCRVKNDDAKARLGWRPTLRTSREALRAVVHEYEASRPRRVSRGPHAPRQGV